MIAWSIAQSAYLGVGGITAAAVGKRYVQRVRAADLGLDLFEALALAFGAILLWPVLGAVIDWEDRT